MSKLDQEIVAKLIEKGQIVNCSKGHMNSKTASFCWICGLAIPKKAPIPTTLKQ